MQLNRRIRSEHVEAEHETLIASASGTLFIQLLVPGTYQKDGTLHISDAAVYAQYGGFSGGKHVLRLPFRDLVDYGVGEPHRVLGAKTTIPVFFQTHAMRVDAEILQGLLGLQAGEFVKALVAMKLSVGRPGKEPTASDSRAPDETIANPLARIERTLASSNELLARLEDEEARDRELVSAKFPAVWAVVVERIRAEFGSRHHALVRGARLREVDGGFLVLTVSADRYCELGQLGDFVELELALGEVASELLGTGVVVSIESEDETTGDPMPTGGTSPVSEAPNTVSADGTSARLGPNRDVEGFGESSSGSEDVVAVARGVVDPQLRSPDPHAGMRFDGEIRLTEKAVYFDYGAGVFPRPRVVRLAREDLRDWKHAELDGKVFVEFATDEFRLSAMLRRSTESDPDALIEFGRSLEGDDLLLDGIAAYSCVLDWERRHTLADDAHAPAAAETAALVRYAEPGVFVDIAERLAAMSIEGQTLPDGESDGMERLLDQIVEASGYVEARARVLGS